MAEKIGEFKITYYKKGDTSIIYSRFFNSFEDALSFAKSINGKYLVFRKYLVESNMYSWELMPYGSYKEFRFMTQVSEYKWVLIVLAVLSVIVFSKIKFNQ